MKKETEFCDFIIHQCIAFLCKIYLFWVQKLNPSQLNKHSCIHILYH